MASTISQWVDPADRTGEFRRQTSSFRRCISRSPGAEFPPEPGRYHLYVSLACPWAHRTLITRRLKQLEQAVSVSIVHWHLGEGGWRFATAAETNTDAAGADANAEPDPVAGREFLSEVYRESDPDYAGRFTVPVLYDKQRRVIVNNESSEILRMLNAEFAAPASTPDLYPPSLRATIDAGAEWIYAQLNNGVYKAGFATSQSAYDNAVAEVFSGLDRAEAHLAHADHRGPFFLGAAVTELDLRLYVTLVRFDPVYVQHFKCNVRDIRSGYPLLHRLLRTLYWTVPAFGHTTNFLHIKNHYTRSHPQINPYAVTPAGPVPDILPLDQEVAAVKTGSPPA